MRRLFLPIVVSLAANVLLALCYLKTRPIGVAEPSSTIGEAVAAEPTGPLTWQDVASEDLGEFVRRLRAVGCPEITVRNIITAEVNRRYVRQEAGLLQFDGGDDYWKPLNTALESQTRQKSYRALQKEKSALLVTLLGVDPEKQERGTMGQIDWREQRLSFLPEEKHEAVNRIMEEFDEKRSGLHIATTIIEFWAEQRRLEEAQLRALAQVLSPEELRQWEVRFSRINAQLQEGLVGFNPSEQEFLAFFDIYKRYGDSVRRTPDMEGKEELRKLEERQKAMQQEIAAALGQNRAKDYAILQDWSFKELVGTAAQLGLPPLETARKVYGYKQAAEAKAKELLENQGLSLEERRDARDALHRDTREAVKAALGEQGFNRYLNQGGYWINSLGTEPIRR
jgi:hypothetical protein